ncbi:MAG: hypothetical protein IPL06_00590 [Betaproteobacteria bacterium]|nr:hypothetical protein [Betaproteobacteria bacterium]
MKKLLNPQILEASAAAHVRTGGRAGENEHLGFRPAFFDTATCALYLSTFADGRPAQVHLLDGLPEDVVVVRSDCGRVIAAKASLVAGFERDGFFYTRRSAARACREWR